MNSSKSAIWAVWAIIASAVLVNFTYAFGLLSVGIEPDMNGLRFLSFSSEVANRSLANGDVLGILYATFTLFSNQFLHGNLVHLGMNMLVLGLLGYQVEKLVGARSLWILFLLGGAIGTLVQHAVTDPGIPLIIFGASGGVMAVSGAYLVLFATGQVPNKAWYILLAAVSLVLLGHDLLAVLGLVSSQLSSNSISGVWVHLSSFGLGAAIGLYYSLYFNQTGAEETEFTSGGKAFGYALACIALISGLAFAGGKFANDVDQRFFHYQDEKLSSSLRLELSKAAGALDEALKREEVAALLVKTAAGIKEMDNQAQLYVYLKKNQADEAIKNMGVVKQFIGALKASNIAAEELMNKIEPEYKAFTACLEQIQSWHQDGLTLPFSELDSIAAPVMKQLYPVNQAQSFLNQVLTATGAHLSSLPEGTQVTKEMEMEAVYLVVTGYLEQLAAPKQ